MTADGIELADLLRLLAGSPLAGFTLADLFPALFADADLPWQDVDLEATPLQNLGSPLVAPATFTTTITVANATPNVSVSLTLPPGFAAVPGSANFDANGSAAPAPVALALPAVTVAGATLTFGLGAVPPGTHTLTVQARAGIRTGFVEATVNGTATLGSLTKTSSSTAAIEVVENPDSSFGPLSSDSLYVGHLVSAGDDDTYTTTFQVTPQQAAEGRKASVYLSNLAADYDLAVFGPVPARASRCTDRGHHPRRRPSDRCGSDVRGGCARLAVRHSALGTSRIRARRSVRQSLEHSRTGRHRRPARRHVHDPGLRIQRSVLRPPVHATRPHPVPGTTRVHGDELRHEVVGNGRADAPGGHGHAVRRSDQSASSAVG